MENIIVEKNEDGSFEAFDIVKMPTAVDGEEVAVKQSRGVITLEKAMQDERFFENQEITFLKQVEENKKKKEEARFIKNELIKLM